MIEIKDLNKSYGGAAKAVNDLSLDIKDGEIFGLLGPNGAGKSTLIKMLVGILAPDSGEIKLNGVEMRNSNVEAKKTFGYVSDTPDHMLRLKGHEFLRFMADIYGVPDDVRTERVARLAAEFEMENQLDNQIMSYSHGMRQKMMVMGALLHDPSIWILDEPMTGLDPRASYILKQRMRRHADEGKTVLFSTHVLDVAEKVVDRVGVISKGKLLFVGTVSELREHFSQTSSLEEMFLELTGEMPAAEEAVAAEAPAPAAAESEAEVPAADPEVK